MNNQSNKKTISFSSLEKIEEGQVSQNQSPDTFSSLNNEQRRKSSSSSSAAPANSHLPTRSYFTSSPTNPNHHPGNNRPNHYLNNTTNSKLHQKNLLFPETAQITSLFHTQKHQQSSFGHQEIQPNDQSIDGHDSSHEDMVSPINSAGSTHQQSYRMKTMNSVSTSFVRMQTKSWSHRELELFSSQNRLNSKRLSLGKDHQSKSNQIDFSPKLINEDISSSSNPQINMPRTVSQLSVLKLQKEIDPSKNIILSPSASTSSYSSSSTTNLQIPQSASTQLNQKLRIQTNSIFSKKQHDAILKKSNQSKSKRDTSYVTLPADRQLDENGDQVTENTPLMLVTSNPNTTYGSDSRDPLSINHQQKSHHSLRTAHNNRYWDSLLIVKCLPAVLLGVVLNILDAMSYGIIIFPASGNYIPETATQAGISMFLASTIIAQLTYSLGGSQFLGGVGSMMIEVMPFLHIMCKIVQESMSQNGKPNDHAILATIMMTYALSSIMTGIVFLLLGRYKLGNVIQFFPRHILVGCIGGIGIFLLITGIEVTSRIKPELSMDILLQLTEPAKLKLWLSSLGLACMLKMFQKFIHHPLFVPTFYVVIPILFYTIFFICGYNIPLLREEGWLFDLPEGKEAPFYTFWTFYDISKVNWLAISECIPTMFALTFFGILHVPINVPALAVSTQQDVDTNQELIGHGVSNLLSGVFGTCQNYLVYSNSVLYFRSGGDTRISGVLLALATGIVWMLGSSVAGLIPVIVVGGLIFHLGIDLLKESVIDTIHVGMLPLEYLTVLLIVFVMGFFGFTEGILTGIVLACVFFVVMYSRKSVIRASFTGKEMKSTVHRLFRQRQFLDSVGDQIHVLQLQGFMFFGTVHQLDEHIDQLLHDTIRVRYIIIDFKLINGIDYSATEAFNRLKKKMITDQCHLILCSVSPSMQDILERSGVFDNEEKDDQDGSYLDEIKSRPEHHREEFDDEESVLLSTSSAIDRSESEYEEDNCLDEQYGKILVFDTLTSALEFCENKLLAVFYLEMNKRNFESTFPLNSAFALQDNLISTRRLSDHSKNINVSTLPMSPRRGQLEKAAAETMKKLHMNVIPESNFLLEVFMEMAFANFRSSLRKVSFSTPKSSSTIQNPPDDIVLHPSDLHLFCEWFAVVEYPQGTVLWDEGDDPNELYIVESGELDVLARSQNDYSIKETYLCGSMIGQLCFFSEQPHYDRLLSKEDVIVWKMDKETFNQIRKESPHLALKFISMALKSSF